MHRRRWAAAVIILALLLAGCGLPLPGRPEVTPVPLPPDRLVFLVESYSGLAPALYVALTSPALAVYGDGRVVAFRDGRGGGDTPAAYTVATVGAAAVAQFAAKATAGGLFDGDTEFGYPDVTDLPATTITLHGEHGPSAVDVYGYSETFDQDVSAGDRRHRRELRALVERARALPGDAERHDYQPDRVRVSELRTESTSAAAAAWPGPAPDTFLAPTDRGSGVLACGVLTAEQARTAYAQARNNPGQVWTVGAEQRTLAVVPVLPGRPGCPS